MAARLEVLFLGTGSSHPSPRRNASSIALLEGERALLMDCGEGTTRQLARAELDPAAVDRVLITHMHGDHVLGVPGLVWHLEHHGRERPLVLEGPPGVPRVLAHLLADPFPDTSFPVRVRRLVDRAVMRWSGHRILARELEHTVPTLGYALAHPEEGRRLAYAADTRPCAPAEALARGAGLLIHEATYADEHAREARTRGHATAREAAQVAEAADVDALALTHISPRYEDPTPLREEAEAVFDDVRVAEDLTRIAVGE